MGNYKVYEKEYECSFELTIELISGKWKGLILWHLGREKVLRYGELKRRIKGITQKMLTQSLRELESHISREVYPVVPPKVEYTLTPRGEKLIPIFLELQRWGREVAIEDGEANHMC